VPADRPVALARAAGLQAYLYPFVPGRFGLDGSYSKDLFGLFPASLHDLSLVAREPLEPRALGRLLAMGGVDYVTSVHGAGLEALEPVQVFAGLFRRPLRLFRVPHPVPRAHVVASWRQVDGPEAYQLLRAGSVDFANEALVADAPERRGAHAPDGAIGEARVVERVAGVLVVEAESSREGLLVVSEAYDDAWQVRLDGRPAALRRANVAFRGVALPAGRHRVEMRYRPRGLRAGLMLSGAGLMAFAAIRLGSRRRRA